jgi:hypothetical protein
MGKRRAPKDVRNKREEARLKRKSRTPPGKFRWWKMPLGALTVLSAIAGVLTLIPRLSLEISGSRDPRSPTKTVFAISNDGLLPVHDVDILCRMDDVASEGGYSVSGKGAFKFGPDSHAATLSPTQKMSLYCDRALNFTYPITKAEMTILVSYRPYWVWWHRHLEFPLKAQKADDGTWIWRRIPQ